MMRQFLSIRWRRCGLLVAYSWLTRGLLLASSGLGLASSGFFWLNRFVFVRFHIGHDRGRSGKIAEVRHAPLAYLDQASDTW